MKKKLLLSTALFVGLSSSNIAVLANENTPPVIEALNVLVDIHGTYDPLEYVYYHDAEDTNGNRRLKPEHVIYNDVDTSKAGVYKVTYRITDSGGLTTEKSISVRVRDREAENAQKPEVPEVDDRDNWAPDLIIGSRFMYVGDPFDPLTYIRCIDKEDGEIKIQPHHVLFNNVDPTKPGEYRVEYKVVDSGGLSHEASCVVFVLERDQPKPSEPMLNANGNKPVKPNIQQSPAKENENIKEEVEITKEENVIVSLPSTLSSFIQKIISFIEKNAHLN